MEGDENGEENVHVEESECLGDEAANRTADDGIMSSVLARPFSSTIAAAVQMDVGGEEGQTEKATPTSLQEESAEGLDVRSKAEVTANIDSVGEAGDVGDSGDGDVVRGDSSEGVKVSTADCGTGGEGVKSDSGATVMTESVKSAGVGGEGVDARSEQQKQLWAAVRANPSDFTSWTSLLQMAEQNVREREQPILHV